MQKRCKKRHLNQVFSIRGLTFEKIIPEVLFYGASGRIFMLLGVLPDSNNKNQKTMEIDLKQNREEFDSLLRSTEREGVEDVISDLENLGFYEAPASAGHHLNTAGGLVLHSLNTCKAALAVYESMKALEPTLENEVKRESVILASLLHDVCKSDIYEVTVKRRKTRIGTWEDSEGYKITYKKFPMGHGEKSVILLLCSGLDLYDDEMLAIRWHMGAFGLNMSSYEDERCYDTSRKLYPLVSIIQVADSLAASILERKGEDLDEL